MKNAQENFNLMKRGHFGDLGIDGRLVMNWNTWTGCDFVDWIHLAYDKV
jgi:hypothetical protein